MTATIQPSPRQVDALERRYRRLLACYPASYRAEYEDEMLGVIMATSSPGQRRPELHEAVDLVRSGLRTRVGATLRDARDPSWRDAAGVFGILAASATVVYFARPLGDLFAFSQLAGGRFDPPRAAVVLTVGWSLVLALAIAGLRRVAGIIAVLETIAYVIVDEAVGDQGLLTQTWNRSMFVFMGMAAALALLYSASGRRYVLTRPAIAAIIGSALAILVAPVLEGAASSIAHYPGGTTGWKPFVQIPIPIPISNVGQGVISLSLLLAAAIAIISVLVHLDGSVRRRQAVLWLPLLAAFAISQIWYGSITHGGGNTGPTGLFPSHWVASQWIAFVAVPTAAFAVGLWLMNRYERQRTPTVRATPSTSDGPDDDATPTPV